MTDRIRWFAENRVIWVEPKSKTTVESLTEDNATITNIIRQGFSTTEMPVHVIIDGSKMDSQPSPLDGRNLLTYITEPGMGYRVVAGIGNPNYHFFSKFVGTLKPGSTLIFPSVDQALMILNRKDKTLPDLIEIYHLQKQANRKGIIQSR